jgi:hypothetical protein
MTAKEFLERIKDKSVSDEQLAREFFEIEYLGETDLDEVEQDLEEIVEALERERPHLSI